jgi:uncharacterized damage-inducible protein DinB
MTDPTDRLRAQLVSYLDWHDAHAGFDAAVSDVPADKRGVVPAGLPHSLWQLLEHLRIAQHDILDFCINPQYQEMVWPRDYWPPAAAPPATDAWDASVTAYRRDLRRLQELARSEDIDLFAKIPHGSGQTYLREILLVADHASYHIGQMVLVRRLLGIWPAA